MSLKKEFLDNLPEDVNMDKVKIIDQVRQLLNNHQINHLLLFDSEGQMWGRTWKFAATDHLPPEVKHEFEIKFLKEVCFAIYDMILFRSAKINEQEGLPAPDANDVLEIIFALAMEKSKEDWEVSEMAK